MIGLPPTAGFVSKWYLGLGALDAGQEWVILVLATSSLLNAAYFLPVVWIAWFRPPRDEWREHHPRGRLETEWTLLAPPVVTAAFALGMGLLAGMPYTPLDLARILVGGLFP
jgi:multicomponent Na+:H+ antiporter subunit D